MAGPALAPRISGRTENCSRRSSAAGAAASSGVCSSTCAGVGQARFSSAVVSAITLPRVRANTVARDISSWERSAMCILSPARPRAGGSLSSQRAARKPAGRLRAYTIEQGDAARAHTVRCLRRSVARTVHARKGESMADRRNDAGPRPESAGAKLELRRRALAELDAAATIMLFAAFRSEVDTEPLLSWALERGKAVCFPRVLGPRRMAAYRIADPAADLVPGAWGIPEPREGLEEVPPERMDAVVVPGAAFD